MSWTEQTCLTQRLPIVGEFLKNQCKHWKIGTSYDGWVNALCRESPRLVPHVIDRLRREMIQMEDYQHVGRWVGFGADGSDVACPRTLANQEAMSGSGQPDGMPQMLVTTLYHLRLGLPWALRVGSTRVSERAHLRSMIGELPGRSLLVADAGFLGYELACELVEKKRHFLLRVGGNVHLLRELGYDAEVEGTTVYLWPAKQQRDEESPLKLRLIVVKDEEKQPVYLVTSVLDEDALTDEEASELYRARWGVEVFYRTTKQTMEHATIRSRTPEHCYEEMTWSIIGVWLLGLMTMRETIAAKNDPSDWSPAASRNTVRRVLRQLSPGYRSHASLRSVLAGCLKDNYQRSGSKASRNYPRKKHQKPPNPPKFKSATTKQLLVAQQLTPIILIV